MKSKIIGFSSGIAVLGLGIFAVVQMNNTRDWLAMVAVVLSLIPMCFLYCTVILGKFRQKDEYDLSPEHRLERIVREKEDMFEKSSMKKAVNDDKGKVLDFPNKKVNNKKK